MLADTGNTVKAGYHTAAKISVIIVTYNAAATLQSCLDSIFKQKYPAIELIIIDGLSTDDTIKIITQNADRITYWKSEKDAGIYDAMNKALQHVTGQWVYFLGADDVLFDDFTNFAAELKDPATIYYARVMCLLGPTIPANAYSFTKYGLCHQAMIYPAAVFKKYSFNTKYKISADFALNMALFNSGEFHFEFKDYLIANFNQTGISSTSVDIPFEKDRPGLVRKYFGTKIWLRYLFWKMKRNLKQTAK